MSAQYTDPAQEFRDHVAQLVVNEGLELTEAARRLASSSKTLANWAATKKIATQGTAGAARKLVTELEAENSRLKRALAEIKMERDLLKATVYFAKESPRTTR